jgi:hypothetical protein
MTYGTSVALVFTHVPYYPFLERFSPALLVVIYCITACALRVAESLAQELELERKSRQQQQQQQQQAERDVKSPLQGELAMGI